MTMQAHPPSGRPRILLVEDDKDIAEVVRAALEPEGYEVVHAATLAAAGPLLHMQPFDLVLCDGLSAEPTSAWQNALTVLGGAGDTPVALFTAHRVDEASARAAGFRAVIEKPFDLSAFVRQVGALAGDG